MTSSARKGKKSTKKKATPKSKQATVEVAGIKKKVTLTYTEEKTPFGTYKLLDGRELKDVPKIEFLRLAEELGMAIISPYGKIFPPGKTARDLIEEQKK